MQRGNVFVMMRVRNGMTISIQISSETEAQLSAKARAQGLSLVAYLQQMLEHAAESQRAASKPLKSSYGILAKHGPAPSIEDIDASRAEMFQSFAQDDQER